MKRKEFIKIASGIGIGLSINSLSMSCTKTDTKIQINTGAKLIPSFWVWMRPSVQQTDDDFKRIFAEMKDLGIEAVLPQIFASNKALFEIDGYETEAPLLERMIPIAHGAGLELHAWMWTMPCNNERIIAEHPDWFAVNRQNLPTNTHPAYVDYYKFLCPRKKEVRDFVQKTVKALANISDLDGIHLDYVRLPDVILAEGLQPKYDIVQDQEFPEYDYCYCETCRTAYKEKTGIDPLDIDDPANDKEWVQFRYDSVVGLVNDYLVPAAKEKNKLITAAVFPNWESVRQQWHKFELDAFLPMLYQGFYNMDIDWIGEETRKALGRLDNSKPVYSGMFLPHLEKSNEDLTIAIDAAYDGGASGFSIFAWNDIKDFQKTQLKNEIAKRKSTH